MSNDDVLKIMGVDEEIELLLPKLHYQNNKMCAWTDELNQIFGKLDLSSKKVVLDIPCGYGGDSVDLAYKFGVTVIGYDIVPGFIEQAIEYSTTKGVSNQCCFKVGDIRDIIKSGISSDLLLWIAPPHIWDSYRETIENLRGCVKSGGNIFIADAYTYSLHDKTVYSDYETLDEIKGGVTFYGDTITEIVYYKDILWARDYEYNRNVVIEAMNCTSDPKEKAVYQRYISSLYTDEKKDTKHLGIFMLALKINS